MSPYLMRCGGVVRPARRRQTCGADDKSGDSDGGRPVLLLVYFVGSRPARKSWPRLCSRRPGAVGDFAVQVIGGEGVPFDSGIEVVSVR